MTYKKRLSSWIIDLGFMFERYSSGEEDAGSVGELVGAAAKMELALEHGSTTPGVKYTTRDVTEKLVQFLR